MISTALTAAAFAAAAGTPARVHFSRGVPTVDAHGQWVGEHEPRFGPTTARAGRWGAPTQLLDQDGVGITVDNHPTCLVIAGHDVDGAPMILINEIPAGGASLRLRCYTRRASDGRWVLRTDRTVQRPGGVASGILNDVRGRAGVDGLDDGKAYAFAQGHIIDGTIMLVCRLYRRNGGAWNNWGTLGGTPGHETVGIGIACSTDYGATFPEEYTWDTLLVEPSGVNPGKARVGPWSCNAYRADLDAPNGDGSPSRYWVPVSDYQANVGAGEGASIRPNGGEEVWFRLDRAASGARPVPAQKAGRIRMGRRARTINTAPSGVPWQPQMCCIAADSGNPGRIVVAGQHSDDHARSLYRVVDIDPELYDETGTPEENWHGRYDSGLAAGSTLAGDAQLNPNFVGWCPGPSPTEVILGCDVVNNECVRVDLGAARPEMKRAFGGYATTRIGGTSVAPHEETGLGFWSGLRALSLTHRTDGNTTIAEFTHSSTTGNRNPTGNDYTYITADRGRTWAVAPLPPQLPASRQIPWHVDGVAYYPLASGEIVGAALPRVRVGRPMWVQPGGRNYAVDAGWGRTGAAVNNNDWFTDGPAGSVKRATSGQRKTADGRFRRFAFGDDLSGAAERAGLDAFEPQPPVCHNPAYEDSGEVGRIFRDGGAGANVFTNRQMTFLNSWPQASVIRWRGWVRACDASAESKMLTSTWPGSTPLRPTVKTVSFSYANWAAGTHGRFTARRESCSQDTWYPVSILFGLPDATGRNDALEVRMETTATRYANDFYVVPMEFLGKGTGPWGVGATPGAAASGISTGGDWPYPLPRVMSRDTRYPEAQYLIAAGSPTNDAAMTLRFDGLASGSALNQSTSGLQYSTNPQTWADRVQTALAALAGVGTGNVRCTVEVEEYGRTAVRVEFRGRYNRASMRPLAVTAQPSGGTVSVEHYTECPHERLSVDTALTGETWSVVVQSQVMPAGHGWDAHTRSTPSEPGPYLCTLYADGDNWISLRASPYPVSDGSTITRQPKMIIERRINGAATITSVEVPTGSTGLPWYSDAPIDIGLSWDDGTLTLRLSVLGQDVTHALNLTADKAVIDGKTWSLRFGSAEWSHVGSQALWGVRHALQQRLAEELDAEFAGLAAMEPPPRAALQVFVAAT